MERAFLMIGQADPSAADRPARAFPSTSTDDLRRTGADAALRRDFGRALPRLREVARRAPDATTHDWQNLGVALVRSILREEARRG